MHSCAISRISALPCANVQNASGDTEALQKLERVMPKWETVYAMDHQWIRRQCEVNLGRHLDFEGLKGILLTVVGELGSRCRNYDFVGQGHGLQSGTSSVDKGANGKGVVRPGQRFVKEW